ncbi:MAG TPA: VOC family protein [Trueperaceae bacterium]
MPSTPKITPFLWFDNQAEQAATFYAGLFPNSKIHSITRYGEAGRDVHKQAPGSVMAAAFQLDGLAFVALNGGPAFTPNPSISFHVTLTNEADIDRVFACLSDGGEVLMPLQAYDFSPKYAWVQDRFGFTWQLSLGDAPQPLFPSLLFVGDQFGRAEEAISLYTSVFPDSEVDMLVRYGRDNPSTEGKIMYSSVTLAGQRFSVMESNLDHRFTFSEAISLQITCETQEAVDHYWDKLSEGGDEKAQQCGWLKVKYGVSWQVVPAILPKLTGGPDAARAQRATQALLQMKKIDIAELQRAYDQ